MVTVGGIIPFFTLDEYIYYLENENNKLKAQLV
jgi:hypothetical protein